MDTSTSSTTPAAAMEAYSPQGFRVTFSFDGAKVDALRQQAEQAGKALLKAGWTPEPVRAAALAPTMPAPATVTNSANGNGHAAPTAPTCERHGTEMRMGRRGWFCPTKIADDDGTGRPAYCKFTVKDGQR